MKKKNSKKDPSGGSQFLKKFKRWRLGAKRSLSVLNVNVRTITGLLTEIERAIVRFNNGKGIVLYFKSLDAYLLGRPMDKCWIDLRKFPRLLRMSRKDLRIARTVISFYREMEVEPEIDLVSITGKMTGDIQRFWEKYGQDYDLCLSLTLGENQVTKYDRLSYPFKRLGNLDHTDPIYCSWAMGPSGPALLSGGLDLCALSQVPIQRMQVEILLGFFGYELPNSYGECSGFCKLSKVVPIPDKGGKTRNIAIGDTWTQLSLAPLHRLEMRILRSLKQDFTFKQDEAVTSMLRTRCPKYSLDLKSATDRFPIDLQIPVVEKL